MKSEVNARMAALVKNHRWGYRYDWTCTKFYVPGLYVDLGRFTEMVAWAGAIWFVVSSSLQGTIASFVFPNILHDPACWGGGVTSPDALILCQGCIAPCS